MSPPTEMPNGLFARARFAADLTPESRNRAADLYRAVAILFVVLGHWLLIAPMIRSGSVDFANLLATQTWTQYLTWLFQVMPVFFFVGGFSNALSWTSARKSPEKARGWASARLARLLKPTVPLVLLWTVAAYAAGRMVVDPALIDIASKAALIPVWFLAVYIMITVAVPVSFAVWERLGLLSVLFLALGAVVVDGIGLGYGQGWIRWANYGFVWLAVHQLGYAWAGGKLDTRVALGLAAFGAVWMWALIGPLGYPVSMVSVPGAEISNSSPPTIAELALGTLQIGLIVLLANPAERWMKNLRSWTWVILVSQMIMTVYLWHITALVALVALSWAADGLGLGLDPGTGFWWLTRVIWVAALALTLIPFAAAFMRFESASRAAPQAQPGGLQAFLGAAITCAGLVIIALHGIGADHALGFNWIAVVLALGGVALGTRRIGRRTPPAPP